MILTIIAFILILGLLIFAHELGHFISAKKAGVKVEEFGFGFPPRIFSIKKGETIYSLNLLPIGGFVKLFGEETPEKKGRSKKAFYNKPAWQRAIILVMGVTMNLVIAFIFLSIVSGIGVPAVVEEGREADYKNIQVQVVAAAENSPAEQAGLRIGDAITAVSFESERVEVKEMEDVQKFVAMHAGQGITFEIKRGKDSFEKSILARVSPPSGEGATGIEMIKAGIIKYPWHIAIWEGVKQTGQLIVLISEFFYQLIKTFVTQGSIIKGVGGPIAIFVYTSIFTKLGLIYVLRFIAILSVSLAIINIVPFPALDGGRLLFLAIEKIKGKPINPKIENMLNSIGFILLMILMMGIIIKDINKFIL